MDFLLDVNVLIARADSRHEHHRRCRRWEAEHAGAALCTCPLTENGFLRIYGHPDYPGGPGSPGEALIELRHLLALPGHRFTPEHSHHERWETPQRGSATDRSGSSPS